MSLIFFGILMAILKNERFGLGNSLPTESQRYRGNGVLPSYIISTIVYDLFTCMHINIAY